MLGNVMKATHFMLLYVAGVILCIKGVLIRLDLLNVEILPMNDF